MELREFIRIFTDRKRLFFGVFFGFVLLGLAVYRLQPERYEAALMLNISRTGYEKTDAYRYDQFYRLQADERFADTVVRWVAAPSVRAKMRSLGASERVIGTLSAKRLSSQMIDVRYSASSPKGFGDAKGAIVAALNDETEKLNADAKDPNWFTIVADEPVVSDARVPLRIAFGGGIASGLFFAFWSVLAARYFGRNRKAEW
jgi:hypothetical protein